MHQLEPDWPTFLEDFQRRWPTHSQHTYVEFVRDGLAGNGAARTGNTRWRRMTEQRAGSAKSVFHFDVQGSEAKSTHADIPWLLYLRRRLGSRLHFWPFDGWSIPAGTFAVVEVYPSLWRHRPGAMDFLFSISIAVTRLARPTACCPKRSDCDDFRKTAIGQKRMLVTDCSLPLRSAQPLYADAASWRLTYVRVGRIERRTPRACR